MKIITHKHLNDMIGWRSMRESFDDLVGRIEEEEKIFKYYNKKMVKYNFREIMTKLLKFGNLEDAPFVSQFLLFALLINLIFYCLRQNLLKVFEILFLVEIVHLSRI